MAILRGQAQTITFIATDIENRPLRIAPTFATGDVKISKDGGNFANSTNNPVATNITGIYKVDLTSTELDAGWVHIFISNAVMDDVHFVLGMSGQPSGLVVADGSNTASTFKTDLAEPTNDHWKDTMLLFVSGSLQGQVKKVSGFNATTDFVTLASALTAAPTAGDRFLLINL
jgi:hypothetical protein